MVKVTLTLVKDIVTIVGVIAGLTYYILSVRNQNRTRQAQLFMQIYEKWYDPVFSKNSNELNALEWEDYDDWKSKYGPIVNVEAYSKWLSYTRFFQGVGVLLKNGLIDVSLVREMMPTTVLLYYNKYEPILQGQRKENQASIKVWEPVEYLYTELIKFQEKNPEL